MIGLVRVAIVLTVRVPMRILVINTGNAHRWLDALTANCAHDT